MPAGACLFSKNDLPKNPETLIACRGLLYLSKASQILAFLAKIRSLSVLLEPGELLSELFGLLGELSVVPKEGSRVPKPPQTSIST